ncbi:MAG: hypothetical protein KF892_02755 [Rhizobacter sp.]|nr:hypothetical protein [Rhizobacter sp.]
MTMALGGWGWLAQPASATNATGAQRRVERIEQGDSDDMATFALRWR